MRSRECPWKKKKKKKILRFFFPWTVGIPTCVTKFHRMTFHFCEAVCRGLVCKSNTDCGCWFKTAYASKTGRGGCLWP